MLRRKAAAKSSHRAQRTCIGCRRVDFKGAMIRLAAQPRGVMLDLSGKLGGRGGYLHPRGECLELFARSKVRRFNSLGCAVDRSERVNLLNMLAERLAPNRGL